MTAGVLMGYPQTSVSIVGNTSNGFIVDHLLGNCYGVGSSPDGLRKWDAYPAGKERIVRTATSLTKPLYVFNCLTYNSQELIVTAGGSNSGQLNGYSKFDLHYSSTFGIVSGDTSPSTALRILAPGAMCSISDSKGKDVIICTSTRSGSFAGGAEINCVNWGSKTNNSNVVAENFTVVGSVPDGSAKTAWALGYSLSSTTMHLYRIGALLGGTGVQATVGSLTPAQIDPTWSTVQNVYGITVDQTDGNLILGFFTGDVVATPSRYIKLNSTTGAVMWSRAVDSIVQDTNDMSKHLVKTGTLYVFGSGITTINTITGVASAIKPFFASGPDFSHGHNCSEDVTGSIYWYGGASASIVPTPAYFGDYCLTQGVHAGSNMGWRFWLSDTPTPPPTPPIPVASRKRAWSFVLDGHTFYVLDLGAQGTFVCDDSTSQWAQFVTQGYVAWNFANGCMWGQRIVAGDMLTTDLWEMQPSALFDNGATEIVHIVTGGVVTRNRIYHSVDQFSLACSVGQLQDGGVGASVTLSFSDDQGKTWTDMDTKTLAQGDYSGDISWPSIGSFTAPGRIFKITDTGGFLRIDGADAGIDGFDTATADPGG